MKKENQRWLENTPVCTAWECVVYDLIQVLEIQNKLHIKGIITDNLFYKIYSDRDNI